jgi:mono/diheme cytochrome c family protein
MKLRSASLSPVPLSLMMSLLLSACGGELPARDEPEDVVWLEQNWSSDQRQWFHHADQGTESFLIPLEWFMALEQPGLHLFGAKPLFSDTRYLAGLGFIPDTVNADNPHGLPVGFAVGTPTPARPDWTPVGLTCAACHTGQMTYAGTALRYDGGPAMIAPDKLMNNLLRTMVETAYNGRQFSRFADRVLGEDHAAAQEAALKRDFSTNLMRLIDFTFQSIESQQQQAILADIEAGRPSSALKRLAESARDTLQQAEGFGRTDALNRIGNQVFALDIDRPANFVAPAAPVSFPFIWDSSWFIWVQYDGSIMQPMVRNAGEALGVGALLTLDAGAADNFTSSVRMDTLHQIETQLAGATPAFAGKAFSGLQAPAWPENVLGEIDRELAATGATLYQQHCQGCHLPAPNTAAFWNEEHWSASNAAGQRLLDVSLIPLSKIGTDAAQAEVLAKRQVDAIGLGLDTQVLTGATCEPLQVKDDAQVSFAFALGAVVQEVMERWYERNNVPDAERERLNGYLPNCLQAPEAYKARPLDGVWATAPYLHNGSVPDLMALLSPVTERPRRFYVGDLEFDPERVGYRSDKASGLFELDTAKPGNSNRGHEFSNASGEGVIGPELSEDQRRALVEYLKTL